MTEPTSWRRSHSWKAGDSGLKRRYFPSLMWGIRSGPWSRVRSYIHVTGTLRNSANSFTLQNLTVHLTIGRPTFTNSLRYRDDLARPQPETVRSSLRTSQRDRQVSDVDLHSSPDSDARQRPPPHQLTNCPGSSSRVGGAFLDRVEPFLRLRLTESAVHVGFFHGRRDRDVSLFEIESRLVSAFSDAGPGATRRG
jgi:hypothetical protein